jgi:hypothetical protein
MSALWAGLPLLVVEDDSLIALPLVEHLEETGARVIGPIGTLDLAFAALDTDSDLAGAVLDVQLGSDRVWSLAQVLLERGIPFVFATGVVDEEQYPIELRSVPRFDKPYAPSVVADALDALRRQHH